MNRRHSFALVAAAMALGCFPAAPSTLARTMPALPDERRDINPMPPSRSRRPARKPDHLLTAADRKAIARAEERRRVKGIKRLGNYCFQRVAGSVPVYGATCLVDDPRDFDPDDEVSTPEEIERWKRACGAWQMGRKVRHHAADFGHGVSYLRGEG